MSNGTAIPPNILEFRATAMHVTEPPPSLADATVIPRNTSFVLSCDFFIGGWLGMGLNDLPGVFEYNVTYYAEHEGPGDDYKFPLGGPAISLAIPCIPGTYSYGPAQTSFTVPANAMQEGEYELKCRVKMSPAGGGQTGPPFHVVASVSGPDITLYQP
jgi:hypothetical protein